MRCFTLLAVAALMTAGSGYAGPRKYDGKPVGTIDPKTLTPVGKIDPNKLPKLVLPKIVTEITYPGGTKKGADGSWSVHGYSATYRATVSTDPKLGTAAATALQVARKDVAYCPLDKVATLSYLIPTAAGKPQGQSLVAETKAYSDYYATAAKCPNGGQAYRADVTFTVTATNSLGLASKVAEVLHLTGINE